MLFSFCLKSKFEKLIIKLTSRSNSFFSKEDIRCLFKKIINKLLNEKYMINGRTKSARKS